MINNINQNLGICSDAPAKVAPQLNDSPSSSAKDLSFPQLNDLSASNDIIQETAKEQPVTNESHKNPKLSFAPQIESSGKKMKFYEHSNIFEPSTREIIGSLFHGSALTINGYIYFVQSVEQNGFGLLRIAKIEDISQTMTGKSFVLIKSDLKSIKVAKECDGPITPI